MTNYKYEFIFICDEAPPFFSISTVFPALTHVSLISRKFTDIQSCMASAKGLMQDILDELKDDEDNKYENAVYSPQTPNITLPEDWSENELCRIVSLKNVENKEEKTAEAIVAQVKILKCEPDERIIH